MTRISGDGMLSSLSPVRAAGFGSATIEELEEL